NARLRALPGYDGSVADIDIALWRGAYRIEGLRIVKTGAEGDTPFFSSGGIDLSVEWRSLLKGKVVAECVLCRHDVNHVRSERIETSQLGQGVAWHRQLEALCPFRFNTIGVHEGAATFRAPGIRTEDALKAPAIEGESTNMTN